MSVVFVQVSHPEVTNVQSEPTRQDRERRQHDQHHLHQNVEPSHFPMEYSSLILSPAMSGAGIISSGVLVEHEEAVTSCTSFSLMSQGSIVDRIQETQEVFSKTTSVIIVKLVVVFVL